MKIKEITVEFKRTQNLGNYSNVTIGTTLNVELEGGEDVEALQIGLLQRCKIIVDNAIEVEQRKKSDQF